MVGVSVGIRAIAGGSYPRWWWDGRTGDAAVCLDASKRLKRSTKGSSSTHPGESRACLKACGHRIVYRKKTSPLRDHVQEQGSAFSFDETPPPLSYTRCVVITAVRPDPNDSALSAVVWFQVVNGCRCRQMSEHDHRICVGNPTTNIPSRFVSVDQQNICLWISGRGSKYTWSGCALCPWSPPDNLGSAIIYELEL